MYRHSAKPQPRRPHSSKLDDLSRLVRRAQYVAQVVQSKTGELSRLQLGNELLLRLSWTMLDSYTGLAELTKADGAMIKRDFVELYGRTMENADLIFEHVETLNQSKGIGFGQHLSGDSGDAILSFVQKIREEHDWVADRLSQLSSTEFENLLPPSEASTKQPSSLREISSSGGDVDDLQRTDVLFTLICAIFAPVGCFQSEDDKRLDLSCTILHRLIRENKSSSKADKFCLSLMDAWSDLYGWGALKHFEGLILDILQSGTRIIERLEAKQLFSQTHNRAYYFSHHQKDDVEEEFYSNAARRIFQLLDDDELGGLPVGALRLAQAILSKVEDKDTRHYEAFISINWFFYRFLYRAITFPEQLGILNDCHISDLKRQRILYALRQKVYDYCVPSGQKLSPSRKRSTIEEEIENHVVSIYAKFRGNNGLQGREGFRLLNAGGYLFRDFELQDSETGRITPSFQLCPTTVHRMFTIFYMSPPLDNKASARKLSRQHSSSSAGSQETLNIKAVKSPTAVFSIGSLQCEDRLEDRPKLRRMSLSSPKLHVGFSGVPRIAGKDEIENFTTMYEALKELESMSQNTSALLEPWQTVFVLKDHLNFELEEVHEFTETQDADPIRSAVVYLVKQFQLPFVKKTDEAANPLFRGSTHSTAGFFESITAETPHESTLLQTILRAGQICFSRRDYVSADNYYKAYNLLLKKARSHEAIEDFSPLLHGICNEQEEIVEILERAAQQKDVVLAHALNQKGALMQIVDEQILQLGKLRLRMWYLCEIRKSKAWERAWEVVKCLNRMKPGLQQSSAPSKKPDGKESPNQYSLPSSSTDLVRTTSKDRRFGRMPRNPAQVQDFSGSSIVDQKVFDALVGSSDPVCQNKLGSEQTRQTTDWMRETEIQNFCPAEERLQRLCYEIDDLTRYFMQIDFGRLGTLDIEEAVVSKVWKSDLYSYERRVFKINGWNRDKHSGELNRSQAEDSSFTGLLRRGSAGDLLNLARSGGRARGNSVGSIDNPRSRLANRNTSAIASMAEVYAELKIQSSPVRSIDTSRRPVWASTDPFNSEDPKQYDEQAIKDFLLRTQLGLTGLILSDFSNVLFWRGSETDEWYNDDITEAALARVGHKDTLSQLQPDTDDRLVATSSLMYVPIKEIAKPRSKHSRNKSSSMSQFFGGSLYLSGDLKAALVPPSIDIGGARDKSPVTMERIASAGSYLEIPFMTDASAVPSTPLRSVNYYASQPQQFPLQKAYKEILQRFSVQVSPYEKLRALYEFQILVVANLTLPNESTEHSLHRLAPTMPVTPVLQQLKGSQTTSPSMSRMHLQRDSLDLAKLRVEELSIRSVPTTPNRSSLYTTNSNDSDSSAPGVDTIVDEIQRLLAIPDLRPKTLFRDLQYIATFIPATILNMTDEGKVFWDFSLAALALKREALEVLVSHAAHSLELLRAPMPPPAKTNSHWNNSTHSLADVITIFTYAAKEKDPIGMRELGFLMLEKPQACPLIVPPFSDPAEVFDRRRMVALQNNMSSEAVTKYLAARAWLEGAASGGDVPALSWLREKRYK
ncbi:protein of unknown function [Taphrina deformans PYCC 5710]|uniref:Uncharacterized protein n=1 Tax=Taphrina deformans (strain PYCC 5710 / ATCC 11124 / CBS 356.35 / IMI 108563 / JCM 9778 / NBRC 8474) TaxID=1097556 RepID=R4XGM0_TAPDE|nr:protein of unknown function [Taphrina deformans PYCC 5710]|eukprot:CCG84941.1 protein of unknown function [Taphrina deformans PYCC 5710]